MQPEAKLKAKLKDGFEAAFADRPNFWFPIVANLFQKAGVPDLFAQVADRSVWIETKANGGELSKSQRIVIPQMVRAGARVVVAYADLRISKEQRLVYVTLASSDGRCAIPVVTTPWQALDVREFWNPVLGTPHHV